MLLILNVLLIKVFINPILQENAVKLKNFVSICRLMVEVLIGLPVCLVIKTSKKGNFSHELYFYGERNAGMSSVKIFKKLFTSC